MNVMLRAALCWKCVAACSKGSQNSSN